MNNWYILARVNGNSALDPLKRLRDLISAPRCVIERFAVPDDNDASLMAYVLQRLLHALQVFAVGHLVGHEDEQDVRVLALRVRQVGQVAQSSEVADEGDYPLDW